MENGWQMRGLQISTQRDRNDEARSRASACAVVAALCCSLLGGGAVVAAGNTPAERSSESMDAGEIAARAAASAVAGSAGEENNDIAAGAYDAVVRDLLLRIESIQKEHGHVARELEVPLFELGKLYVSADQCQNAIPILRRAILLSQRLDGVMNPRQLRAQELVSQCYVARDMVRDLERAQEQMLLVHESAYGKDDVRMISPLVHAGAWYEQAGEYQSARDVYSRAMRIAIKAGGDQDIRLVIPLRALARTYRLEMQYETERLARPGAGRARTAHSRTRRAHRAREHGRRLDPAHRHTARTGGLVPNGRRRSGRGEGL